MNESNFNPFDFTSDDPIICDLQLSDTLTLPYTDAMLARLRYRLDNPPNVPQELPTLINGTQLTHDEYAQVDEDWRASDERFLNALDELMS